MSADATTPGPGELWIEVVSVPVSDVERSKQFYEGLGWRLDDDISVGEEVRVCQFTPPGSHCSIGIEKGLTKAEPGSVERLEVAVHDIEATRAELILPAAILLEKRSISAALSLSCCQASRKLWVCWP